MRVDFRRCLHVIAVAVFLCVCATSGSASAPDDEWQAFVDKHTLLTKQGKYQLALEVATKAVATAETTRPRNDEQLALSLNILGASYTELGRHEEALQSQKRALELYEKSLGPDHPDTALSLGELANTFVKLNQYNKALPLQQHAVAIHEKTRGSRDPLTVSGLSNLAYTYRMLAQYDKAQLLQEKVLKLDEETFGPEHLNTAMSLNNLATTYMDRGKFEMALPLQQRALAIREKVLGPEHLDTTWSMANLANTYRRLAHFEEALPLEIRALNIRERILGTEHPDTAFSMGGLAACYALLAQYERALPLQQRALAIFEKVLGPSHPTTTAGIYNLASTYDALGLYDKALPLLQRAVAISDKHLGTGHQDTARNMNNLAMHYLRLAQYDKALPLLRRVLAIFEQVLGTEHPETASSLGNLASVYSHLGQYEKALPLEKRALAIDEKMLGSEHPSTALRLNNLAETYRHLARLDEALPLQLRALAIFEKSLGPENPVTASSLSNLAGTYHQMGQYENALPMLQRALMIKERALGDNHPDTALGLHNLARVLEHMAQTDSAIAFYKAAVNAYQSQREKVSRIDETALRNYTESVSYTYQALAGLLVAKGMLADAQLVLDMMKENEQFEFIRRSSSADPRLTRIGYNSNEQVWMTRYRQIADRLASLGAEEQALKKQEKFGLSAVQQQRQQALASDLRVAQTAFDSFLKEMREGFGRQGPAKAAEASETSQGALRELQDLIKGVGPDTVLLQYYVTDDKVGMLLTTPGVQLARSTTVKVSELNRKIAEFRRLLRNPKSDALTASQTLYRLLVAPVEQDLVQAGAKTVMLSLDGTLRYLPFGALHDGQRYMVERWNLPMYTSVTKNRLLDDPTARWQGAGLGITKAVGQFAALPAVRNEMRSIFKTASNGVLPGEVYLDEAFTAQRFKDMSQRPLQLLHVASHFQFSPGTEIHSFLLLGDGQKLTLGDIRTQNYRFDHLDLLTLSACDTGLGGGRDATGREIEGFGVIAQQQGAKAVLATLWPVADESTAKLMAEMYRRRQDNKLTKTESLRQAQLSLLEQTRYEHPFYWAPFILMGNWK